VLDVSGSMRAADIDGRSRMSVAQQSFDEVVDALPAETQLGIRVLGSRYRFPGSPKTVGCRDTEQISPVGPVNKVEAKTAIATLRPTGWTPIGLALRSAAKDLGRGETTRRIVLITDGEDTCAPPDPCDVARELAAQGTTWSSTPSGSPSTTRSGGS
jgi:Ca-activated chloride channel family protein